MSHHSVKNACGFVFKVKRKMTKAKPITNVLWKLKAELKVVCRIIAHTQDRHLNYYVRNEVGALHYNFNGYKTNRNKPQFSLRFKILPHCIFIFSINGISFKEVIMF